MRAYFNGKIELMNKKFKKAALIVEFAIGHFIYEFGIMCQVNHSLVKIILKKAVNIYCKAHIY